MPLCPPQVPHGRTRVRTRASEVEGRQLTAWALAWPNIRRTMNTETSCNQLNIVKRLTLTTYSAVYCWAEIEYNKWRHRPKNPVT
jgi:hypothetical protein